MLQKITILLSLLLTITACKGGGGGSSQPPAGTINCIQCGEFIPNEPSQLGDIANYLLDNDPSFQNWYFTKDALTGTGQMYNDAQLIPAIRAFVHSKAKAVDSNGVLNVLAEEPFDAFMEAVINNGSGSRGVNNIGLCHLYADALKSFTVDSTVIIVTGSTHTLAIDGTYCVVEVHMPNGNVVMDPVLNRSFGKEALADTDVWQNENVIVSRSLWFSSEDLLKSIEAGLAPRMSANPDGMVDAPSYWAPLGDYYKSYESLASSAAERAQLVSDLHEQTFVNISYVKYSELR